MTKHLPAPRIPLWAILIIPSITIIISISILINFLSYRNSQATVNTIAEQLLHEINARIELRLNSFLDVPTVINRTHAHIIQSGTLDLNNAVAVEHYFWETIQVFESVSSTYFGSTEGGLINAGREGMGGALYIMATENFASGDLDKYATDDNGNRDELVFTVSSFDARTRPWYVGAVETQTAYHTDPYILSTGQDLAIASSLPVYDDDNNVLGVASVDIFLSQISDFLNTIDIGITGEAYIIDSSGLLVASSTESTLILPDDETTWRRVAAVESENPHIAASSQIILDTHGHFNRIHSSADFDVSIAGEQHYLWITPYANDGDFDWYIVTIIPEKDFFAQIDAHNQKTIFLIVMASLAALIVGALTAMRVAKSIGRLNVIADALAKGDWSQNIPMSRIREVNQLGQSFNSMSRQLHDMVTNLEGHVQARTKALAASEERYRAIIEDQTELICRFLPDNTLTFVNKAYSRYFNQTPETLLGKSFMPFLPTESREPLHTQLASINRANPILIVEHPVITPDGKLRWVQWVNRALFDTDGNFIEYQAVGRDITDHKQLEENLQKSLSHAIELNELKTHFVSTVSHEFRTPMSIILSSSDILQRYDDRLDIEKKKTHLVRINEQISRMTEILEGVLMINRAERGKLIFRPIAFDLQALCQAIIIETRTITSHNLNYEFTTTGVCQDFYGDEKLVRLIISNLVSNAAKYTLEDGTVHLALDCNEQQVSISVQDNGIGISKDVQTHIFDPFYRANVVETIEGIGLGLTIVKQCVELHHGTIAFSSTQGQGTEFTVILPKNSEDAPQ